MTPYTADFLLGLIIPGSIPMNGDVDAMDVEFDCRDGWKVNVFYDVGELDYINHFVTPNGDTVDFWKWPDSDERQRLLCWRGGV